MIKLEEYFKRNYVIKTNTECICEDYKTSIVLKKPKIPKNEVFKNWKILHNFYGVYIIVRYKSFSYYIDPRCFDFYQCL